MKDDKIFVDTNVIVYAYDASAGEKYVKASGIMKDLWNSGHGIISTQVLQELFVTLTNKIAKPLDIITAREIVKDLLRWKTVIVGEQIILEAIDIHSEHKFSFWDAVVISSAIEGGAMTLLSEDLSDRRVIKGVNIKNPFRKVV